MLNPCQHCSIWRIREQPRSFDRIAERLHPFLQDGFRKLSGSAEEKDPQSLYQSPSGASGPVRTQA